MFIPQSRKKENNANFPHGTYAAVRMFVTSYGKGGRAKGGKGGIIWDLSDTVFGHLELLICYHHWSSVFYPTKLCSVILKYIPRVICGHEVSFFGMMCNLTFSDLAFYNVFSSVWYSQEKVFPSVSNIYICKLKLS